MHNTALVLLFGAAILLGVLAQEGPDLQSSSTQSSSAGSSTHSSASSAHSSSSTSELSASASPQSSPSTSFSSGFSSSHSSSSTPASQSSSTPHSPSSSEAVSSASSAQSVPSSTTSPSSISTEPSPSDPLDGNVTYYELDNCTTTKGVIRYDLEPFVHNNITYTALKHQSLDTKGLLHPPNCLKPATRKLHERSGDTTTNKQAWKGLRRAWA